MVIPSERNSTVVKMRKMCVKLHLIYIVLKLLLLKLSNILAFKEMWMQLRCIEQYMSRDIRFPTMWSVRAAKTQTSLRIRAV